MALETNTTNSSKTASPVTDQTHRVMDEAMKLGNQLYEEGKEKIDDLQHNLKESSDKLLQKIHEKPVHSLLIAAAAGFLLAHLLRK